MNRLLKILCCIVLLNVSVSGHASLVDVLQQRSTSQTAEFIPAERAFLLDVTVLDNHQIQASWLIEPGYFLYAHAFKFLSDDATIGAWTLPAGGEKHADEMVGEYTAYHNAVTIQVPVTPNHADKSQITVYYQGCADSGYCYPPIQKKFIIDWTTRAASNSDLNNDSKQPAQTPNTTASISSISEKPTVSEQGRIAQLLMHDNIVVIVLSFLGFGILLTFTPCVLPMIPILSTLILGRTQPISKWHAFSLSVFYSLGVALVYGAAGVFAGWGGQSLQSAFQTPWLLSLGSAAFVLLALSMFGLYQIRLPHAVTHWLTVISSRQSTGHAMGALLMGGVSALIVSPCITPPLVGALMYIGQSGNALLGASALFSLGLGMGIPLILGATFGVHYLPKAGSWLETVSALFGVLLLGLAIWMLERFMQSSLTLFLWSLLFMGSGLYLGALEPAEYGFARLRKLAGFCALLYGILLFAGTFLGQRDPLSPLPNGGALSTLNNAAAYSAQSNFVRVTDQEQLTQALSEAKRMERPVMLYFTADWCVSCHVIKRTVFQEKSVLKAFEKISVIEVDITKQGDSALALQQKYKVFAPPSMVFFKANGQEVSDYQLVGDIKTQDLLTRLAGLS